MDFKQFILKIVALLIGNAWNRTGSAPTLIRMGVFGSITACFHEC
jgi:hypothetical protein